MLEANTIQFTLSEWAFLFLNRGLFTEVGLNSWLVVSIVILCDVGSCDDEIYAQKCSLILLF